jgi:EF hand
LSLEEYLNALFKDFDAADVDKDGSVTIEELDVYIRARK